MRENGVEPDAITYGTVLKACEGENALSSIRYLLDEMDSLGERDQEMVDCSGTLVLRLTIVAG